MYAYFFIGPEGSIKHIMRTNLVRAQSHKGWRVISYNDDIMTEAKRRRIKPEQIFPTIINEVKMRQDASLKVALRQRQPVVIDVPELCSREQREQYLKMLPDGYKAVALWTNEMRPDVVPLPHDQPPLEVPSVDEGFSEVRAL